MDSASSTGHADHRSPGDIAGDLPNDGGSVAEHIGVAALELACRARAAGLTTLGYLLESAALEAGTEAATRRWPDRAAED